MAKKKVGTESKSDVAIKRLMEAIGSLEDTETARRKKSNRRDDTLYGGLSLFYAILLVVAIVTRDWSQLLFTLAVWIWVPMVWILNRTINGQRYVINMMSGVHSLEVQELEIAVKEKK